MLAIFGIGFPAFIAFLNYSFNQKELDKIKDATIQAEAATAKADEATKKAEEAYNNSRETYNIALSSINQITVLKKEAESTTKKASNGLTKADESFKANKKLKNEILNTSQSLNEGFTNLNFLLSEVWANQNEGYNFSTLLYGSAVLYQIKELKIITRYDVYKYNEIPQKIFDCKYSLNKLIQKLQGLKEEDFGKAPFYATCDDFLHNILKEYQKEIEIIKNNLPDGINEKINEIQKTIEEAIDIIREKVTNAIINTDDKYLATIIEDDEELVEQEDDQELVEQEDDQELVEQEDDQELVEQEDDQELVEQEDDSKSDEQDSKEITKEKDE